MPNICCPQVEDAKIQALIAASAAVGVLGFFMTRYLIPPVTSKTAARGICGKDLNKKGTPAGDTPIPEAAGLAVGCAFLLCIICFELLHYYDVGSLVSYVRSGFQGSPKLQMISDSWLVDYNAALATIGFMLFLGFADDVLDIRWRVKILLPLFAALPLLVAYSGGTGIVLPKPLQALLGLPAYLDIGVLYKVNHYHQPQHSSTSQSFQHTKHTNPGILAGAYAHIALQSAYPRYCGTDKGEKPCVCVCVCVCALRRCTW